MVCFCVDRASYLAVGRGVLRHEPVAPTDEVEVEAQRAVARQHAPQVATAPPGIAQDVVVQEA